MTIRDLTAFMETLAPAALAEEWDNVGLLVGDADRALTRVVVALDITEDTIAFAQEQGAELIVAHHPLIFSAVKRVLAPSPLYRLAASGIAAFAAHTNLDAAAGGVNDALCEAIGLTDVREAFGGIGRVGTLAAPLSPCAFAELVGGRLNTPVQLREGTKTVRTVALVSGAGGEYAADAEADAFLTGEMKHHEWLALPHGLTVAAAGHYATENVIVAPLCERLREAFPALTVLPFYGEAPYRTL